MKKLLFVALLLTGCTRYECVKTEQYEYEVDDDAAVGFIIGHSMDPFDSPMVSGLVGAAIMSNPRKEIGTRCTLWREVKDPKTESKN